MKRLPASQKLRKELRELLEGRVDKEEFLLGELIRRAAAIVVQELLEEEAKDFLGRDHYQRRKEDQRGYRNGYEPFEVNTAEGRVTVLKNNSEVLEKLAIEMYARGLPSRDIEDALLEATSHWANSTSRSQGSATPSPSDL